jgi:hypothetical protein
VSNELDEYTRTVQNAVDLLASKGKTAEEIADFFRMEDISGGYTFQDCPVYNWLQRQVPPGGNYVFYVGLEPDDRVAAVRISREAAWLGWENDASIDLPQHLLDFIDAHDSQNRYGLDPNRDVVDNEIR